MRGADVQELLQDKRVIDAINKHLWIESQKAGYSLGIDRATDEWLRLYSFGWLRKNMPDRYKVIKERAEKKKVKVG